VAATVAHIIESSSTCGGILVFVSGVQEIRQTIDAIGLVVSKSQAEIIPLHANLTNEEQKRVFTHTSNWKVIVSTNVAEVSN
jgi:ATP-dependent RNA helicase DHX57